MGRITSFRTVMVMWSGYRKQGKRGREVTDRYVGRRIERSYSPPLLRDWREGETLERWFTIADDFDDYGGKRVEERDDWLLVGFGERYKESRWPATSTSSFGPVV